MRQRFDRLTIRWRVALTTAGLCFAILALFAVVTAVLVTRQMESSFDKELKLTAVDLEERLDFRQTGPGQFQLVPQEGLVEAVAAGDGVLRVLDVSGRVVAQTTGTPDLGAPTDGLRTVGAYRVVTRPVRVGRQLNRVVAVVQYGKPLDPLQQDTARVKLFLAIGVVGGTILALLAGLAVARRAMAPIAGLTRAANEIALTRDPALKLPAQKAEDEVADLARTLARMLAALDAAQGETEAALARQREFVADASHELRTPLTSVLVNLEMLEAALTGEDEEIASSALRSSRRMRRLVADLLLLARADAGRRAAAQSTDLAGVLRDAAAEVTPLAGDHDLVVDAPEGGRVRVEGVPDDLHRLARNLLENALTHTPDGTTVRASARHEGQDAVLVVEDDGPGIPPELRDRVFERFVRASGDRAAPGGGSGLGLAIVRAVAETHGGSVTVDESEGGGARFTVRLPAAVSRPKPVPASAPAQA